VIVIQSTLTRISPARLASLRPEQKAPKVFQEA
jgi:hypothetical protein